ncbi:hypothetical protein CTA2_3972 [Colletotrichum tanaceti]|nr:hypothetical protein CTA2_3972 [Colletotrichum tanaceti]
MNIALKGAMPEALMIRSAPSHPASGIEMLPLDPSASAPKQNLKQQHAALAATWEAAPPQGSPARNVSVAKSVTVIVTLAGINFLNTMGLKILAAGCLLLILAAVADLVGAKLMWLAGSYLCVVCTLANWCPNHLFPHPRWHRHLSLVALADRQGFLPHIIMGTAGNVAAAWLVSRVKVQTLGVGRHLGRCPDPHGRGRHRAMEAQEERHGRGKRTRGGGGHAGLHSAGP